MTDIQQTLAKQKKFFQEGRTKNLEFRLQNLARLKDAIIQNEAAILKALNNDLSKSTFEGYLSEVGVVLNEIRLAGRKLKSWARPRRVRTPFTLWFGSSRIYYEPYGIALIIAPWNYPFQLSIAPLIGAMAAGNCSILKPSEYAPRTAAVLSQIIGSHFANTHLPFGGVGNSGMGRYHGKASFEAFSHHKGIFKKSFAYEPPLRYPPYKNKLAILRKFLR